MKNTDIVRQAIAIFQGLQERRSKLQEEIDSIDQALGQIRNVAPATAIRSMAGATANGLGAPAGRSGNALPLREVVIRVLATGPKTKDEIMAGVRHAGYRFTGTDPMNSLQSFLYGAGKKLTRRIEGKKFALAASASQAAMRPAVQGQRRMSAEGRKRIAEAARTRWAKVRAGKTPATTKPARVKRTMSPAARAKISAAAKARWARVKAGKK